MAESGQIWTDEEVEAIVADYFAMLSLEQSGQPFIKAEHRRLLKQKIDRTDGSIERKHQNISAVMALFGLPFIDGYKPLGNYQQKLFEKVQSELRSKRELHDLLTGRDLPAGMTESSVSDWPQLNFDPVPPAPSDVRSLPDELRRIVKVFGDPAERDARNRRLGKKGEEAVFESEKGRLTGIGRDDLAKEVRWVARDEGDGLGYDIVSFDGFGAWAEQERWLEVKTTAGAGATPFFITRNELRVADANPEQYRIVRLYNFNVTRRAFKLQPPLRESVDLAPSVYEARLWKVAQSLRG